MGDTGLEASVDSTGKDANVLVPTSLRTTFAATDCIETRSPGLGQGLAEVVHAWSGLSESDKVGILSIVRAAVPRP